MNITREEQDIIDKLEIMDFKVIDSFDLLVIDYMNAGYSERDAEILARKIIKF